MFDMSGGTDLEWQSVTTGNFAGFIATLEDCKAGSITIETALINQNIPLDEIGYKDKVEKELPSHNLIKKKPPEGGLF